MVPALFYCTTFTTTLPCEDDVLAWDGPPAVVTWGVNTYAGDSPAPVGCYEGWVQVQADGKAPVNFWWEADPGRRMEWSFPCDVDPNTDITCPMADR